MPLPPLHILSPIPLSHWLLVLMVLLGLPEKREGGILRSEHQAEYRRSIAPKYFKISVMVSKSIFALDAMNNPRKSISGDTVIGEEKEVRDKK